MAILVKQMVAMIKRMPPQCVLIARTPNGGEVDRRPLHRIGHHNREPGDVHPEQPVEIFTEQGDDHDPMTVKSALADLADYPPDSLIRIAVPQTGDPPHHRCLDIDTVGFASSDEDYPPVEVHTERWDSQSPIIRMDDHSASVDRGDVSYARELTRHDDGTYTESGPVKMTVVGRAPQTRETRK